MEPDAAESKALITDWAVLPLLLLGLVTPFGVLSFVGIILLWTSKKFLVWQKIMGSLVVVGPIVFWVRFIWDAYSLFKTSCPVGETECGGSRGPSTAQTILTVLYLKYLVATIVVLYRQLRPRPTNSLTARVEVIK